MVFFREEITHLFTASEPEKPPTDAKACDTADCEAGVVKERWGPDFLLMAQGAQGEAGGCRSHRPCLQHAEHSVRPRSQDLRKHGRARGHLEHLARLVQHLPGEGKVSKKEIGWNLKIVCGSLGHGTWPGVPSTTPNPCIMARCQLEIVCGSLIWPTIAST